MSFSFSSVDDNISALVEPGVPPPSARLETLARIKKEGVPCGMFLLPVIPFLTDQPECMEEAVRKASQVGLDFIIFGGMTLKEGKQKAHFFAMLQQSRPQLLEAYEKIYTGSKWGEAVQQYTDSLSVTFHSIARKHRMPVRIPVPLYQDILDENDLVVVMLEHIDYLLKLAGEKSPFGYAAYSLSQVKEPLSSLKGELPRLRGVSKVAEAAILEILETRTSSYYEELLARQTGRGA